MTELVGGVKVSFQKTSKKLPPLLLNFKKFHQTFLPEINHLGWHLLKFLPIPEDVCWNLHNRDWCI